MEIKEQLTKVNFNAMSNKENKYIVIHYVGAVSTAKNNADYFENVNRNASANYFVDENEIYRVVKDSDKAWHVGGADKYYNDCRNSNSIGIEMCCYMNNGKLDIKDEVINKTIELTKELMAKYNISVENVVRHYDVTHKNCPAPLVEDTARWYDFKNKLAGEVNNNNATQTSEDKNTDIYNDGKINCIYDIQEWLKNHYGFNLALDNIYGPDTHKKMVMALQTELNSQFNVKLVVDGIFGTNTYNVCINIRQGAEGNLTRLIQMMLFIKGYSIDIDGIYGSKTALIVGQFQNDNNLAADKICGKNTFKKLFE